MGIVDGKSNGSNYRWYILTLIALTSALVFAMPTMCMPVLFKEISKDLNLSLVQIGTVWGTIPLSGAFVVLIGGLLADRFGAKRMLTAGCFLTGLAGLLRGLSDNFFTLSATMFLYGLVMTVVAPGMIKACSVWFSGRRLGLANGVLSMSMGMGFMVGSMISATILSPLLGSWRNVLFLYGAVSVAISFLWLLSRSAPSNVYSSTDSTNTVPLRQSLSQLVRNKRMWIIGLIVLGQISCVQGMLGYLPVYLEDIGWTPASASGALTTFHAASTIATVPIALLSDRLGSRKVVLFTTALMTVIGVGLLSVTTGAGVWAAVVIAGLVRDGFMAVQTTMIIETKGVGPVYAGTAIGLVHTISRLGECVSPPIGNSLAGINLRLPFVFWAALAAAALSGFYFLKDTGHKLR